MAYGIIKMIGYFSKDLYCLAFQYDLACGIFLIILGVVALSIRNPKEGGMRHYMVHCTVRTEP
ncbi:MAG: hypothetical protein ACLT8X_11075 [Mediterraneibacter faecis]|uniref:hypothetical protein n=1 Tax=[Ruminococcus] torques TaxID=33039 RepID=UPI003569022E